MSGGSLDYVYCKVDDAAGEIRARGRGNPLYMAFATHLENVAKALHDLEWVFSSDYGEDGADEAIKAIVAPAMVVDEARINAESALAELKSALDALQT